MVQVDRIVQMQQQGMSDNDIIKTLKNEGVTPKEISDSIAQAKIKMAVSQEDGYQESYNQPAVQEQQAQVPTSQYQEQQYPDQSGQQYYYPDQSGQSMNIETITEIVDRILSEKLKELNQKIKPVVDFKNKADEDINDLKERLKRIESTIDNLQRAIIGKVGEFGQSTALIHKDLENLHGTVSKLMNPLIDNVNEMKKFHSERRA
jgi:archaellum component FlaC